MNEKFTLTEVVNYLVNDISSTFNLKNKDARSILSDALMSNLVINEITEQISYLLGRGEY